MYNTQTAREKQDELTLGAPVESIRRPKSLLRFDWMGCPGCEERCSSGCKGGPPSTSYQERASTTRTGRRGVTRGIMYAILMFEGALPDLPYQVAMIIRLDAFVIVGAGTKERALQAVCAIVRSGACVRHCGHQSKVHGWRPYSSGKPTSARSST